MDDANRSDLIARLFAMITAQLEDAAAIAAEVQQGADPAEQRQHAARLVEIGRHISTVSEAAYAMLET